MKKTEILTITALVILLFAGSNQGRATEAPTNEPVTVELLEPEPPAAAEPPVSENAESNAVVNGPIRPGEQLTVERCVQIALRNSPNILEASYIVNATRSRVAQAWSGYYPQITLSSAYSTRDTLVNNLFFGPTPQRQDGYTNRADLTLNLIDFGRTGGLVSVRQKELEASGEDLRNVAGAIIFNVKKAYYDLLKAGKSRDVLRESVELFEKQLELARNFYEAGMRSRFDVTTAEVDLGNERLRLIGAENALRVARVTLNSAMGMPDIREYTIEDDTLPFQKYAITFEEARDMAFLNRPDIRFAAAQRQAADESLSLARKEHYPTISTSANYSRSGAAYPPDQDTWQVDIALSIPFFTGFQTTHRVAEAKESLYRFKAREEAVRQNVLLNVQQVYLKLREAEERVGVAKLTVKQAEENYELAQGRYEAGLGSPIDVTDALVKLSRARENFIAALADYKAAEAELRRAMGE